MKKRVYISIIVFLIIIYACICFVGLKKSEKIKQINVDKDSIDTMTIKALENIGKIDKGNHDNDMEALKALAVIVRTNYIYGMLTDTLDETEKYIKNSFSENVEKRAHKAVKDTNDMVITYNDQIVYAFFHKVSPLKTISGGIEYLREVECPRDIESDEYVRIEYIAKDIIGDKLESEDKNMFEGMITVEPYVEDDKYMRVVSKGIGDGKGLSIYDAYNEARDGKNYISILKKYYKNIVLKKVCYE